MDLYGHTFVLSHATLCAAMVVYFIADSYDCINMMLDNVEYHLDDTEPWFWFSLVLFFCFPWALGCFAMVSICYMYRRWDGGNVSSWMVLFAPCFCIAAHHTLFRSRLQYVGWRT